MTKESRKTKVSQYLPCPTPGLGSPMQKEILCTGEEDSQLSVQLCQIPATVTQPKTSPQSYRLVLGDAGSRTTLVPGLFPQLQADFSLSTCPSGSNLSTHPRDSSSRTVLLAMVLQDPDPPPSSRLYACPCA